MSNTDITWGSSYDDGRESQKRLDLLRLVMQEDSADEDRQMSVVDLGANAGFFSKGLADSGYDVTAIEPPNGKKLEHPGLTEYRHWVQAPEDLPEGPFDYSIVFSVLHHIPQWKSVLEAVLERTNRIAFVEIPHVKEQHHKWHGSLEQTKFLNDLWDQKAQVIGNHWEVSKRYKRELWKVDTRVR